MAVQQNKKSPSKRGMHRSHDFLTAAPLAVEPSTGEVHLRHHISPNGYYRGKKVVKTKNDYASPRALRATMAVRVTTGSLDTFLAQQKGGIQLPLFCA